MYNLPGIHLTRPRFPLLDIVMQQLILVFNSMRCLKITVYVLFRCTRLHVVTCLKTYFLKPGLHPGSGLSF